MKAEAGLREQLPEQPAEEVVQFGRTTVPEDERRLAVCLRIFSSSFVFRLSSRCAVCQPVPQRLVSPAQQKGDAFLHGRLDLGEWPQRRNAVVRRGRRSRPEAAPRTRSRSAMAGPARASRRTSPGGCPSSDAPAPPASSRQSVTGSSRSARRAGASAGAPRAPPAGFPGRSGARRRRTAPARRSRVGARLARCTRFAISSATQSSICGWKRWAVKTRAGLTSGARPRAHDALVQPSGESVGGASNAISSATCCAAPASR